MKIFFFSPHAYISAHALPEALVAEAFRDNGHEILQVGCNGLYEDYCIAMSAAGLWPDDSIEVKRKICIECKKKRNAIQKEFHFDNILIDDYLSEEDLNVIDNLTDSVNMDNYLDFSHEGIPVGRYATYEFLLNEKINTSTFSNNQWLKYLINLKNALLTLLLGKKIFNLNNPDKLITYNSLYSVNHIMCALAEKRGISHYSLHAGDHHLYRLSQMTIFRGLLQSRLLINRQKAWDTYSRIPLSARKIDKVALHIDELILAKSPWVYSLSGGKVKSNDLRIFFGIDDDQKVLLVTMSSADELFAAAMIDALPAFEEPIFKTQLEWIEFLIEWANSKPGIFIIIRVHPREFPNKRENVLSGQAKLLMKYFDKLPENVRVNWPDDHISLHDIIKITDVGLNATSTAGLELLMFGVPVVIYNKAQLFSYPSELNLCGENKEDYLEKIKVALTEGLSLINVIGVYRWLSFRNEVVSIDISDGYRVLQPSLFIRGVLKIRRRLNGPDILPGLVMNRRKPLKNQKWLTFAVENNLDNHLEEYVLSISTSNKFAHEVERKIIHKKSLILFNKFSKEDDSFRMKIQKMRILRE